MPQMSPMLWFWLFMYNIIIFIITMVMIYYLMLFLNFNPKKLNFKNSYKMFLNKW